MQNIITSLLTILLSIFFLVASSQKSESGLMADDNTINSMFWPRFLLIIMLILGIILLIKSILNKKFEVAKSDEDSQDGKRKTHYWVLISTVLYILAIQYIGFVIATPICLFIISLIVGLKKVRMLILIPIISSVVIVIIFPILLNVPMPRGVSIFREFSLLFY